MWNDSTRLSGYGPSLATSFSGSPMTVHWVIADDGSSTAERAKLEQLVESFRSTHPQVSLHLAKAHRGKGAIIRDAWDQHPQADWLAFVDADGSVSAGDLLRLIGEACDHGLSVIGIRKRTATTEITESLWRSVFHHGYLLCVHLILGLRSDDLQCGAKVIRGGDYRAVARDLKEDGFSFDTELLAALQHKQLEWMEVPVTWREKAGAKVRPLIDAWTMFLSLLRIRGRHC